MAIRVPRTSCSRRRARLFRQGGASLVVLLLAGSCTGPMVPPPTSPQRIPVARSAPTPVPVPVHAAQVGWQDMAITPGEWRWSRENSESTARFGLGGQTVAMLSCRAATVTLLRTGNVETALPGPTVVIRTTSISRPNSGTAQPGAVAVVFDARDPLLDAMAFSRGRFAIEVQGMAALALPSWPEVARVIDDCRG